MAQKFTPRQLDDIVSMHSCGNSVAQIVSKLRETTNAVVLNKDVYHALSRAEKGTTMAFQRYKVCFWVSKEIQSSPLILWWITKPN